MAKMIAQLVEQVHCNLTVMGLNQGCTQAI